MVIHYIVVGGTDITNVSAFQKTSVDALTGNHSYNGTGTAFTPDFALIMNSPDAGINVNTVYSAGGFSQPCIGAATGTSNEWAFSHKSDTIGTSAANQLLRGTGCIDGQSTGTGSIRYSAEFVSFNSAAGGGITVNVTDNASSISLLGFLLVKGGKWDVAAFQQRSGTGTQTLNQTDSTVTPKVVSLFGVGTNSTVISPVDVHNYTCIGASDGTREGNSWNGHKNGVTPWQTGRSTDTGKVFRNAAAVATASSITTAVEADMQSLNEGSFTLNWTTADTTQRWMGYWSVGEVVVATTPVSQTSIQKYALRKNVAATTSIQKYALRAYVLRTNIQKYQLGGILLVTCIQKYNILKYLSQTAIQKYSILKYVTRTSIHKYNLAAYVLRTIIQKYGLGGRVLQSSIHKYHVISLLTPIPMTTMALKDFVSKFLTKL